MDEAIGYSVFGVLVSLFIICAWAHTKNPNTAWGLIVLLTPPAFIGAANFFGDGMQWGNNDPWAAYASLITVVVIQLFLAVVLVKRALPYYGKY